MTVAKILRKLYFLVSFPRNILFSSFDGRVVAHLPFTPISWLQGISHRNLLGKDYTECSFIFLYILCTMSIRQVCMLGLSQIGINNPYQIDILKVKILPGFQTMSCSCIKICVIHFNLHSITWWKKTCSIFIYNLIFY